MKLTEKIKTVLLENFSIHYSKTIEKRKSLFLKKLQTFDKNAKFDKCSKNIFRFTIGNKTNRIVVQRNSAFYDETNYSK